MTWEQRAKAGVDAKHFQEALKAKSQSELYSKGPQSQNGWGSLCLADSSSKLP
jgi:hypothetical protein